MTTEQKLSKIETLRMAQAHIKALASLLAEDDSCGSTPLGVASVAEELLFDSVA
jgi:hypothetical protein